MKVLFAASAIAAVLAISPASAAMMACTSENMAKSVAAGDAMQEGPVKRAMMKELGDAIPLCRTVTCAPRARAICAPKKWV